MGPKDDKKVTENIWEVTVLPGGQKKMKHGRGGLNGKNGEPVSFRKSSRIKKQVRRWGKL